MAAQSPSRPRLYSHNLVWNVSTLVWDAMTQPGGGGGGAGDASAANQITEIARLTSLLAQFDVALSTRTKPADQQHVIIDSSASHPVTGPLTDVQLRATPVPVSGTITASGPLTDTQLRASAVPMSLATLPALVAGAALIGKVGIDQTTPGTTNAVQANAGTNLNTSALALESTQGAGNTLIGAVIEAAPANDTASSGLNGRLQRVAQRVTALIALLPAALGANGGLKIEGVASGTAVPISGTVTITPPTLTKGAQGATGLSTQDLKDAGRNISNLFMPAGVAGTNAEVMQTLTGYKSGAAVTGTATPAVITSGKTYRITQITLSYQSLASAGGCLFRLRANLSGTGAVGSPLVMAWIIGSAAAVAGITTTLDIPFPDGMEFAAGTGIAVGMLGLSATGGALASGFGTIAIYGYEY